PARKQTTMLASLAPSWRHTRGSLPPPSPRTSFPRLCVPGAAPHPGAAASVDSAHKTNCSDTLRDAPAGILPTPTAGSDDDVVAVADGWYSNPVAAAVAPLRPARAGSQTAWLPVLLRLNLPATANRSRPPLPVPDTRGLCPAPFRNCVRSGAAPTPTRNSTAGLPSFSAWTFSSPAPYPPSLMEFQCRVIVQRRCTSCCSESQRNRVRLPSGIAFTFDRIPQLDKE